MSTAARTLAIVDDEPGLRQTLAGIVSQSGGWTIVGSYPDAVQALPALLADPPAVVLMDIEMPGMSGIECTAALKAAHPEVLVLMLTVFDNPQRVFEAMAAGASGYLLKRDAPARLRGSLEEVLTGGAPVSSTVARKMFQHFLKDAPGLAGDDFKLSPREQQILELLAKGWLYKEIAHEAGIATETVRFHLRNIYRKLHVRTRTEAVVKHLGR